MPIPPPADDSSARDARPPEGSGVPSSGAAGPGSNDPPTHVSNGPAAGQPHDRPEGPRPTIEGYQLQDEIHRGGQGVVYRAVQLGTKREVALKVLLEGPYASRTSRRRFEREIELAAALRHPNIVTILDSGLSMGRYYFAMEYIQGERLDRYLARHRPPLGEIVELFEKICDAVNFAHQRGVIHRDLKPPNILVDEAGQPHVLDFGLAKHMPAAGDESTIQVLSTSGQILGTVAYMSPEQAAGSQDVDVRSDVYSLGVIFYESLVGQPPYPVTGPLGEVLTRIARDEPTNPRSLTIQSPTGARIDDDLATILLKALEKEPSRRYQTAASLGRDLRHWLEGDPIEAKRASGFYMFKKALRRYRLQAAVAGAILLMLIGFLITFAVLFAEQREATRRAAEAATAAQQAVRDRERALQEQVIAQRRLRQALVNQHIQRGDLALEREELIAARDSYWSALELQSEPPPAAVWALRRFYLQRPGAASALMGPATDGLSKLGENGRFAATATSPRGIAVQVVDSGNTLTWVRTPGEIKQMQVCEGGMLAAAGSDWARVWRPGELRPSVVVQLPGDLPQAQLPPSPQALYVTDEGHSLVIIFERQVAMFRGAHGNVASHLFLQGTATGPTAYAPKLHQIAVATTAGVELVTVSRDRLASQIVWHSESAPRDVRFDSNQRLALMTQRVTAPPAPPVSSVHTATIAELARHEWSHLLDIDGEWDLFDLDTATQTVAFATRDGRFAVFRGGRQADAWSARGPRVEELRLQPETRSLITLDDDQTITEWMPPQWIEQHRVIAERSPLSWAASSDGRAVLMGFTRGQAVAYLPGRRPRPFTLLPPRMFATGGAPSLAVNADGTRAAILDGRRLRFANLVTGEKADFTWPLSEPLGLSGQLALSGDGQLAALLASSATGDRQRVAFVPWQSPEASPGAPAQSATPPPFDFVGAEIRALAFVPQTHTLLVGRSNGELFMLDPHSAARPAVFTAASEPRPRHKAWLELDTPVSLIALSRTGTYAAAACDDNRIRLIPMERPDQTRRISVAARVSAMAFNPRDNLLLVRLVDGTALLVDPATAESVMQWRLETRAPAPMALWLVETDAMLLGYEGRVTEQRFQHADQLIDRNRPFAWQREAARHIADGSFNAAWGVGLSLAALAPQRGRSVQIAVLESALRRPRELVPDDWADSILAYAAPTTVVRLGHAAYEGERFTLARRWLRRGRDLARDALDAETLWRLAGCDYLAGAYDDAAIELAGVLAQRDLDPALAPTIALQRVAALVLANRIDDARSAALRIGEGMRPETKLDDDSTLRLVVAQTAAQAIARFVAGLDSEVPLSAGWETLLTTFGQTAFALEFHDDVHFFRGELARQRGESAEAAVQYQRCIDLSRDPWPANWSRFRLAQLASGPAGQGSEVPE